MKLETEEGYTTFELAFILVVVVVLGATIYLLSRTPGDTSNLTPSPTTPPTTLTITHNIQLNHNDSGYTVQLDNSVLANAVLTDINELPLLKNQHNCSLDTDDSYTLHFTDPDTTFTADYGGCYLISQSNNKTTYTAYPSSGSGSRFWSALSKATGRKP